MSGFPKVEFSSTMKQMYKDKERFREHIQINNPHKKIKKVVHLLKLKDVGAKVDVKKILIVELAPLLQQLTKVLVDLAKVLVALSHHHHLMTLLQMPHVKNAGLF